MEDKSEWVSLEDIAELEAQAISLGVLAPYESVLAGLAGNADIPLLDEIIEDAATQQGPVKGPFFRKEDVLEFFSFMADEAAMKSGFIEVLQALPDCGPVLRAAGLEICPSAFAVSDSLLSSAEWIDINEVRQYVGKKEPKDVDEYEILLTGVCELLDADIQRGRVPFACAFADAAEKPALLIVPRDSVIDALQRIIGAQPDQDIQLTAGFVKLAICGMPDCSGLVPAQIRARRASAGMSFKH